MNRRLLRRRIAHRAGYRCEYCKLHEATQVAAFHLDHIVPTSRGGGDGMPNRCYLCVDCNLRKNDRMSIPAAEGTEELPLFNPRTEKWNSHFAWSGFRLRGISRLGIAMIAHFGLNSTKRIRIRRLEASLGLAEEHDSFN
jgi:HNH endonuclease